MELAHSGKKDKRKDSQKAESKKVRFRSLEGREIRGQLPKNNLEWKVSKRLLGKMHQKKKTIGNKEGTSHQSCCHNMGSGTQGSKERESAGTPEP